METSLLVPSDQFQDRRGTWVMCPHMGFLWPMSRQLAAAAAVVVPSHPPGGEECVQELLLSIALLWDTRFGACSTNTRPIVSGRHRVMSEEVMKVICCWSHMDLSTERGLKLLIFLFVCLPPSKICLCACISIHHVAFMHASYTHTKIC